MPLEAAVFKLHPGLGGTLGHKSYFDLAGMRGVRVVLPPFVELPGQDDAFRRLEGRRESRARRVPHLVQIVPHRCYSRRVDPIDAPRAFGAIDDQAGLLEYLQMLGHRGPTHRHNLRELADGARTPDESLEDGAGVY